jgi:hypothetical protein
MIFMKANGTRFFVYALLAELLFLLLTISVNAQPEFDFSNGSLVSGTQRTTGAVYRFTQVRPGVDAFVRITNLTNGVTLNDIDGSGSGFRKAFQPVLQVPARTNGYAEFGVSFVIANTILPSLQLEVPMTPIDVDGQTYSDGKVFEYDQIQNLLGLGQFLDFNMLGGELNLNLGQNWLTGRNTAAIDYPGVDTLAKQAMFTAVFASLIGEITIRVGADNQSNGQVQRLRSVYFKRFTYANSFLATPALSRFTGVEKDKKVALKWNMTSEHSITKVIIEKGNTATSFKAIGEVWMNIEAGKTTFNYTDATGINSVAYYRLKMVQADGNVQYSNILTFRTAEAGAQQFKVYPSVVNSSVSVNLRSGKTGAATFQVVDYSGRIVNQQNITVQEGNNNVVVAGLEKIIAGNYVVVVKTDDDQAFAQKIVKQ